MLPFPARQILPSVQIPIPSVSVQNPPVLLSPKSVCQPLSARTADGEASPFPASAGNKRYNTLDFPAENRVPTGMLLAPIGNPEPKGLRPSGHPIYSCGGYPSCSHTMDAPLPEQVKQAQRFARIVGRFLCLFLFSSGWAKHTQSIRRTLGLGWRFSYWSAKTNCPKPLYLV